MKKKQGALFSSTKDIINAEQKKLIKRFVSTGTRKWFTTLARRD
ncbi:hypothetical protein OL548_20045 [Lysinibacillus sp. MHQ-1]|nr:hypothetical protein OL548_20045 [Lysinibacillus sp. MHQ-1]